MITNVFGKPFYLGVAFFGIGLALNFIGSDGCNASSDTSVAVEQCSVSDDSSGSDTSSKSVDVLNSDVPESVSNLLPTSEQTAETLPHFPNRTAAFVWRNWNLVPIEDMAETLLTQKEKIAEYATCMGMPVYKRPIWEKDSVYITVLRRNWSLLPYEQLLTLLRLSPEKLAKRLREDDFLSVKLGAKPRCEPLLYEEPSEEDVQVMKIIASEVHDVFASDAYIHGVPRFDFLHEFERTGVQRVGEDETSFDDQTSSFKICYLHSYFALFGDPLLQDSSKIYPDALFEKLASRGVNGVWLHSLLRDLAPPCEDFPEFGEKSEIRRENLRNLVERAKVYGIDVYLYMNEPRAMPTSFFDSHEEERGVTEGAYSAMCVTAPKVRKWLSDALAGLFSEVPGLGGIFTITGSENLTSCVSHGGFMQCPRCSKHSDADLLVDLNAAMEEGVHRSAPDAKVIVWDWGWRGHGMATDVIERLPKNVWLQSVSEWGLPIERGGVPATVGEYSISAVGPGARALAHWETAKRAGLKTIAKCQFNTTWETGSIPSVPALDLVARHACNLRNSGVDGVMAGWSLGGFPSINLELVHKISTNPDADADEILSSLAREYFGSEGASSGREGWRVVSSAFEEFPFDCSVVYTAPNLIGPANLLRLEPTGWRASMVGIPYDDVNSWRGPYPPEVFASQMEKCGQGFLKGSELLKEAATHAPSDRAQDAQKQGLYSEFAGSVFLSVANQTRFILLRDERIALMKERSEKDLSTEKTTRLSEIESEMVRLAEEEIDLGRKALDSVLRDSCIGFESTNQYWFVPNDLVEKIISCHDIVRRIKAGL